MKWSKLLQRLTKKATGDSKALAQKIIANASALTAKKKAESDRPSPKPNGDSSVAGVKRVREGENGQPASKKTLMKPSSKPLALQNAERRRAMEKEEAAKKAKDIKPGTTSVSGDSTAAATKAKVILPPKPPSISLMSASKKPGTTNAERAAAAKDKTPVSGPIKQDAMKRESPPRTVAPVPTNAARTPSSFMGLLSDFDKKKEVKPDKENEHINESSEQRAKRIRKESRRKLRVSWKAEGELVETRLFTHDPEEELGHDDSMMRDAGDTMSEGEMLKRKSEMRDLEDEDDDEEPMDSYTAPLPVDFSVMPERDPTVDLPANGIKYGGELKPESPSSEAQMLLEANTLMAVFDGKTDRPTSPKEPPDEGDDDNFQPCMDFGEPTEFVRARERQVLDLLQPPQRAMNGLDLSAFAKMGQSQPKPAAVAPDLSSILNSLRPAAPPPAGGFDLKSFIDSQYRANQQQQQPQQQQYQAPQPVAIDATANLSALLAMYQANASNTQQPSKHGLEDPEERERKKSKQLPPNYKTQVCSFWKEGRCTKGDDCTYKHSD
jgi:hypothetical protein